MSYKIEILAEGNFRDFLHLLRIRGEAPEDFYRWKYLEENGMGAPRGYIAYIDGKPVGCIGNVPRKYVDRYGSVSVATWFADWYVLEETRGKGVGKGLMQAMHDQCPIGFGIPGPDMAQIVAEKAGYVLNDSITELAIPLKKFRYGFKRYAGNKLKRLLRALRELASANVLRSEGNGDVPELKSGFPDTAVWEKKILNVLSGKSHLLRDKNFFDWLSATPVINDTKEWWHWEYDGNYAFGYVETDYWGLKRSRILDLIVKPDEKRKNILLKLIDSHRKNDCDFAAITDSKNFCYSITRTERYYRNIPIYQTEPAIIDHITGLDRENWWFDQFLKPINK